MESPEDMDPRMRKQQLLIQQQLGERMGYGPGMPQPGMPQASDCFSAEPMVFANLF